ncbi:MAG: hypothetical protein P4M09_17130 [Devosia sp.]|nr:hypothetical protein [Devosia sp.]
MTRALDLAGCRFERLTAIRYVRNDGKRRLWLCRCDCGTEIVVRGSSLTEGNTRSCGCLVREKMAETGRGNGTHRLSRTLEYHSWISMNSRCYNQKSNRYQYYGARGIIVCQRWRESFEAFLADMGRRPTPSHSIDRLEVNGNYEPGNCRWATPTEQRNNRTDSKERISA